MVILPPERYPTTVFAIIGTVLGVLVYSGLAALLRSVQPRLTWLHLLMLALAVLAQVGRAILGLSGATALLEAVRLPAIGAMSVFLFYAGVVSVRAAPRIASATESSLIRRLGWLLIGFAPASTLVYVLLAVIPQSYRPPLSLDFVFALLWSVILISVFVRYLLKPEEELEDGVSPAFCDAHGITKREAEVIALVAEGLSNKQIAERLFVSLATVRTHVYNIFRKTDATSRMDLLRIMRHHGR
ncbi:MAG: hypothetical protein GVY29_06305 [Spirochaetes bacterium]|nr:hypothetical protein [Spirochaetota bacterium]